MIAENAFSARTSAVRYPMHVITNVTGSVSVFSLKLPLSSEEVPVTVPLMRIFAYGIGWWVDESRMMPYSVDCALTAKEEQRNSSMMMLRTMETLS